MLDFANENLYETKLLTCNKAVHHCKYLLSGLLVPTLAE